jgi:hypothetical protein
VAEEPLTGQLQEALSTIEHLQEEIDAVRAESQALIRLARSRWREWGSLTARLIRTATWPISKPWEPV